MENGREHYSDRLDRIEGIIEATASRQAEIEDEFSRLLKAQVVLHDNASRFHDEMSKFVKLSSAHMELSSSHMELSNARMDRVEQNLAEATDKLNALIAFTEQHHREHRENPQGNG